MLNRVRIVLKSVGIALTMLGFVAVAYPGRSRRRKVRVMHFFSRLALWVPVLVIAAQAPACFGKNLLPFKKSLCACATETLADVLPVCLNYAEVDGAELGGARKAEIFYHGDMEFFPHLRRLLTARSIGVTIHPLECLKVSRESCRKQLADAAFQAIQSQYVPIS